MVGRRIKVTATLKHSPRVFGSNSPGASQPRAAQNCLQCQDGWRGKGRKQKKREETTNILSCTKENKLRRKIIASAESPVPKAVHAPFDVIRLATVSVSGVRSSLRRCAELLGVSQALRWRKASQLSAQRCFTGAHTGGRAATISVDCVNLTAYHSRFFFVCVLAHYFSYPTKCAKHGSGWWWPMKVTRWSGMGNIAPLFH